MAAAKGGHELFGPMRLTLAVEMRQLRIGVAAACGSAFGHRFLDCGEVRCRKTHIQSSKRFAELVALAGSDDGKDVFAARSDPGDCNLRYGHTEPICDLAQGFD